MKCLAEALGTVAEGNRAALGDGRLRGEEAGLAHTLEEIAQLAGSYLRWVREDFVPMLTPLERALLELGGSAAQHADDYLQAYARVWCAPEMGALDTPLLAKTDFAGVSEQELPDLTAPDWMGAAWDLFANTGEGMTGAVASQPWWLHPVTPGFSSEAALRFKQDGRVRIGCRSLEEVNRLIVGLPPETSTEQDLPMVFPYADDDLLALCHLLVLSRTGRARLAFLTPARGDEWNVLRMVSVPVPEQLRTAMREKAVAGLDRMTGADPGVLERLLRAPLDAAIAEYGIGDNVPGDESEPDIFDDGLFAPPGTLF